MSYKMKLIVSMLLSIVAKSAMAMAMNILIFAIHTMLCYARISRCYKVINQIEMKSEISYLKGIGLHAKIPFITGSNAIPPRQVVNSPILNTREIRKL